MSKMLPVHITLKVGIITTTRTVYELTILRKEVCWAFISVRYILKGFCIWQSYYKIGIYSSSKFPYPPEKDHWAHPWGRGRGEVLMLRH